MLAEAALGARSIFPYRILRRLPQVWQVSRWDGEGWVSVAGVVSKAAAHALVERLRTERRVRYPSDSAWR